MNRIVNRIGRVVASRWPWPVLAKLNNGRRLYVDLRSRVGQGIYVKGEFDAGVFQAVAPVLSEGSRFLDVGANAGFYSMLALDRVGTSGRVDAFEIDQRSLLCLNKTKHRFSLDQLQIHPVAIGDHVGTTNLMEESECGNSYCSDQGDGKVVPMTTLDTWAVEKGVTSIQAIKIDVEGFEMQVVRGAESVLDCFKPWIVLEAEDSLQQRHGTTVEDLVQLLRRFGYMVERVDGCWMPTMLATPVGRS